jgi:hypothetical protein
MNRPPSRNSIVTRSSGDYFGGYAGKVSLSVSGLPPGASYTLSKSVVTLAAGGTATCKLTVSLGSVVFPLQDSYTLVLQGTSGGGLLTRPSGFWTALLPTPPYPRLPAILRTI